MIIIQCIIIRMVVACASAIYVIRNILVSSSFSRIWIIRLSFLYYYHIFSPPFFFLVVVSSCCPPRLFLRGLLFLPAASAANRFPGKATDQVEFLRVAAAKTQPLTFVEHRQKQHHPRASCAVIKRARELCRRKAGSIAL